MSIASEPIDAPRRRLSARDFDQKLITFYDRYAHGQIDRGFLEPAAPFAAGGRYLTQFRTQRCTLAGA